MMPTVDGVSETREYLNEDGDVLYIPFINTESLFISLPAGYTPYVPERNQPESRPSTRCRRNKACNGFLRKNQNLEELPR